MAFTVFYAWQSDLPNRTNRGLIEDALGRAVKSLARDVEVEVRVDKDTQDLAGAVSIAESIFQKIREADAFVADVSLVVGGARRSPNPNVLVELGYAAHALGWEKIIPVCNTAVGPIEELPFDIRGRRVASYVFDPESEGKPAGPRSELAGRLESAIRAILENHDVGPSVSVSPSEALIAAMEVDSVDKRLRGNDYMEWFDRALVELQPPSSRDPVVFREALEDSIPIVRGFQRVCSRLAVQGDEVVLALILKGLEPLADRARASPRPGSSQFYTSDADFEIFVGQEVLLILVSALAGAGHLSLAKKVIQAEFYVNNSERGVTEPVGIARFCDRLEMIEAQYPGRGLYSPAGEMLKERHGPNGPLHEDASFKALSDADALIGVWATARRGRFWLPPTAPYWGASPPRLFLEAQRIDGLERLQSFLGVGSKEEVAHAIELRRDQVREWVTLSRVWEGFDLESLGSRSDP